MTKLISLVLDKAEAKAEVGEPCKVEAPRYPYGTCLYLDEVALKKLGLECEVGDEVNIVAVGKVTGMSSREYENGKHETLDIQLTAMSIDDGDEADEALESPTARKLYPKG
jgi:hypothetical protein